MLFFIIFQYPYRKDCIKGHDMMLKQTVFIFLPRFYFSKWNIFGSHSSALFHKWILLLRKIRTNCYTSNYNMRYEFSWIIRWKRGFMIAVSHRDVLNLCLFYPLLMFYICSAPPKVVWKISLSAIRPLLYP